MLNETLNEMLNKVENITRRKTSIRRKQNVFMLLSLSLVIFLIIGTITAPQINGLNATLVTSHDRSFRQIAKHEWVESNISGIVQQTYTETKRNKSSIYLSDVSGSTTIVLDTSKKVIIKNAEVPQDIVKLRSQTTVAFRNFDNLTTTLKQYYFTNEFTPEFMTDGCSIPKTVSILGLRLNIDGLVPDNYYQDFYAACVAHDYCYVSSWVPVGYYDERALCDSEFLSDMKDLCYANDALHGLKLAGCLSYAHSFYTAVSTNSQRLMFIAVFKPLPKPKQSINEQQPLQSLSELLGNSS